MDSLEDFAKSLENSRSFTRRLLDENSLVMEYKKTGAMLIIQKEGEKYSVKLPKLYEFEIKSFFKNSDNKW